MIQHPHMGYSAAGFDLQKVMQDALAAHQRADFQAAAKQYSKVLREIPLHADATHFLGLLEHQRGNTQAALILLHRSIKLNPVNPLYPHNLAGVYKEIEKYTEAEQCYRRALTINANYVDSYIGLATIQLVQREHAAALENCERALTLSPSNFAALEKMGEALHGLGKDHEAIQIYRKLMQMPQKEAKKLHIVGTALHAAGANADAASCLREATELSPDSWEIHNSLGIVLGDAGDLHGAETSYRNALQINPDSTGAFHNLVSLVRLKPNDLLWKPLMGLSKRLPELPPSDAIPLHFALGAVWEHMGDYAQAFGHFLEGNRKKRDSIDYEENRQIRFYQGCKKYFDSDFMAKNSQSGHGHRTTFVPIFIVGMSRSGTTLVEQILASHPQMYGAGEIQQLWHAVRAELNINARNDDDVPARLTNHDPIVFQRITDRYCASLKSIAPDAKYITDKLSGNVALIGLIHVAFPGARIIHCIRDPLDTCVSCFSKLFTSGHLFSYDLGELGRFYRLYENLMQHWTSLLPESCILEVHYEDVVTDLEGQARRLVAFCDLDWDARCLHFYETTRSVRTASLAQVHQPIYSNAIGRWRHYDQYLATLKQALTG